MSRDVEKEYGREENIQKLERLVKSLKENKAFEIQVAGERLYIPANASFTIEHEVSGNENELEFQFKWKN